MLEKHLVHALEMSCREREREGQRKREEVCLQQELFLQQTWKTRPKLGHLMRFQHLVDGLLEEACLPMAMSKSREPSHP